MCADCLGRSTLHIHRRLNGLFNAHHQCSQTSLQSCQTSAVLIGVTHAQESGTRNLCKFLERVSCFLAQAFFIWYQKLVLNRMQLYSVHDSGTKNLYQIVTLVQVSGTRFLSVSPPLIHSSGFRLKFKL